MLTEFYKEYEKELNNKEIVTFLNATYKYYFGQDILEKGNYSLKRDKVNHTVDINFGKDKTEYYFKLTPFEIKSNKLNDDTLTLDWKKYLFKRFDSYNNALRENRINKVENIFPSL